MKTLLHKPDIDSTLYNPDQNRFQKDHALFDKFQRETD